MRLQLVLTKRYGITLTTRGPDLHRATSYMVNSHICKGQKRVGSVRSGEGVERGDEEWGNDDKDHQHVQKKGQNYGTD